MIAELYAEHSLDQRVPLLSVKDLLWFLYLYPFRFLAALASPRWLHFLCRLFDPAIQFRSRKRRKLASDALLAAGFSASEAERISRGFVRNAALRVMDDLIIARGGKPESTEVTGMENLEKARSNNHGVLLLTAHFYANRIAKRYLETSGHAILTVRNGAPPDALSGRIGRRFLQKRYMRFIHRAAQNEVLIQDPECTLKILQRLRAGGLVNIQFDTAYGKRTRSRTFLGVPRTFSTGILDIVNISGCAVVPMLCTGSSAGLSVALGEPIAANLPTFVKTIEDQVKSNPEQWELWTRL